MRIHFPLPVLRSLRWALLLVYVIFCGYLCFGTFSSPDLPAALTGIFLAESGVFAIPAFFLTLVPLWCLAIEPRYRGAFPSFRDYVVRYGGCIVVAYLGAILLFFWRQDPDIVMGSNRDRLTDVSVLSVALVMGLCQIRLHAREHTDER